MIDPNINKKHARTTIESLHVNSVNLVANNTMENPWIPDLFPTTYWNEQYVTNSGTAVFDWMDADDGTNAS
jgi:hypothetical protein